MEHLNSIVRMYFQKVSSSNILCGELDYRCFCQDDFHALTLAGLKHLSETETRELYLYLSDHTEKKSGENGLNVFRALKNLVKDMLLIRDDQPLCQYARLMQWHELTRGIGEDLPICAFLAQHTERTGYIWRDFGWNTVIGHDNMQLNRIMQRGLSDNHFHLFGSAPAFKLSWLKLMNELDNNQYAEKLRDIDQRKRVSRVKYALKYKEDSLEMMHLQAALIRMVLFYFITMQKRGAVRETQKVVKKYKEILRILTDQRWAFFNKRKIQISLDRMKVYRSLLCHDLAYDYANLEYGTGSIHHDFAGERALMYQMLLGRVGKEEIPGFIMNWFYAYLVIQIKLREELVQVNQNVGFENFSQYSRRKNGFLYTGDDDRRMVRHAVLGSLSSGNIRSLEIRISPGQSAEDNRKWIQMCDDYLMENGSLSEEQMAHIYYVIHFPKEADGEIVQKTGFVSTYRHDRFRNELEQKANELIILRENAPKEAGRVLGIDACGQEIGCRPEVFAPVFRRLTNHVASSFPFGTVRQWKITYHVGEDWIDFADGLRAIDEAVLFFMMKNGDRLGHATVLGLNAKEWYRKKGKNICLPMQDYLDNVVWLYHKLIEFDIRDCETLKGFLHSEYGRSFKQLYQEHLKEDGCKYDIGTYYEAWKLRGDHPLLCKKSHIPGGSVFQEYWADKLFLDNGVCKGREEAARLMYYYHYSASVRYEGGRIKDFVVPDVYIDGVAKVQKAMQYFIAERGIGIEANPSSNYMISTMDSYEDHPISKLFNMGLVANGEELTECAQMHISINTDDKGIFQTSLENEYALMSCALENVVDENGKRKYQKQMVYEWLDQVREHGNQQSFLQCL